MAFQAHRGEQAPAITGPARLRAFQRRLALWVLRVWLALALGAVALAKLIAGPEQVQALFPWSRLASPDLVLAAGAVELTLAAGLLVPRSAAHRGPALARLAAMASFGLGAGFAVIHLGRLELAAAAFSGMLAGAALLVVLARPGAGSNRPAHPDRAPGPDHPWNRRP